MGDAIRPLAKFEATLVRNFLPRLDIFSQVASLKTQSREAVRILSMVRYPHDVLDHSRISLEALASANGPEVNGAMQLHSQQG